MEAFRNTALFVVFIGSSLACTGCKFGFWCHKDHMFAPIVVPSKTRVQVQPLPVTPPDIEPIRPKQANPWKDKEESGPKLEPTPIQPKKVRMRLRPQDEILL